MAFTAGSSFDLIEFQNSVQADELRFGPDWAAVTGTTPIMTQAAAPVITTQPTSQTVTAGVSATLMSAAGLEGVEFVVVQRAVIGIRVVVRVVQARSLV